MIDRQRVRSGRQEARACSGGGGVDSLDGGFEGNSGTTLIMKNQSQGINCEMRIMLLSDCDIEILCNAVTSIDCKGSQPGGKAPRGGHGILAKALPRSGREINKQTNKLQENVQVSIVNCLGGIDKLQ